MARDHIVDDLLHLRMRQVSDKLRGVESHFVMESREHCDCERDYAAMADELLRKRRFLDEMRDELKYRRTQRTPHTIVIPQAVPTQRSSNSELLEALLIQNSQTYQNMAQQMLIKNMSKQLDPPVIALPSVAPPHYAPAHVTFSNPHYTHRETYRSDPHSSRLVRYYLNNYTPARSNYQWWN